MSDTQTTSRGADSTTSAEPVFTEAEEAWLADVAKTYKVPLSAEQYGVVRGFLRSTEQTMRGAA